MKSTLHKGFALGGFVLLLIISISVGAASPPAALDFSPPTSSSSTAIQALTPTARSSTNVPLVLKQPTPTPLPDYVPAMIAQVSRERALTDLRRLTGEEQICSAGSCYTIRNRQTGSVGLQKAEAYVAEQLAALGFLITYDPWSDNGYADQNILASWPGATLPQEKVYFVAHLDTGGTGTELYPGADDDGSGVADLLELARVLSGHTFKRTIVLFFSTGEEHGSLGVNSYLKQYSAEINAIRYVVNIDMIGYDANDDGIMQFFHRDYPNCVVLTQVLAGYIVYYGLDLVPQVVAGCP